MTDSSSNLINSEILSPGTGKNLCDEDNRYKANISNKNIIENEVVLGRGKCNITCNLSLYMSPPSGEFPLDDLYACTNQRYRLLLMLSDIGDCEMASKDNWIPEFVNKLSLENIEELKKIVLNEINAESAEYLARWDEVSHFALRTASSRLFESLKWFVKQEVKLFHIRWHLLTVFQRRTFMKNNEIALKKVDQEERQELSLQFQDNNLASDLFKTRFTRISQLLKTRAVNILRGWVYYTEDQAIYPIANLYEDYLNKSVRLAKAKYDRFEFDSKYSLFFRRISEEVKQRLFKFNPSEKSKVEIKDLDRLSLESFPLCMSNLHYYLRRYYHLRNGGRLQYSLFLKGIGVTLYDAIKFWRDIFTKKMTLERFTQHYLYSIRHNYGRLGKQADYPPLSCAKILDFSPGPLDHHGCPFQKAKKEELYNHLHRYGLSKEGMNDVWELVKSNVPQQACARVFEIKHNVTGQEATAHPNIFYEKSKNIRMKKTTEIKVLENNVNQPTELKIPITKNEIKSVTKNLTYDENRTITSVDTCKESHLNRFNSPQEREQSDKKLVTLTNVQDKCLNIYKKRTQKLPSESNNQTLSSKSVTCISCTNQDFSQDCNKDFKKMDW